jgi:hypothetical protein
MQEKGAKAMEEGEPRPNLSSEKFLFPPNDATHPVLPPDIMYSAEGCLNYILCDLCQHINKLKWDTMIILDSYRFEVLAPVK